MANKFESALKTIGKDFLKVVNFGVTIEQKAAPVAAALFPQFAPEIDLANKTAAWIKLTEQSFAAAGQQSNGPAKLDAMVAAISADYDAFIKAQLPGSAVLQDAESFAASKADYVNSIVKGIDAFSVPAGSTVATAEALIVASAVKAAATAAVPAK
jgi:hypothetical protein